MHACIGSIAIDRVYIYQTYKDSTLILVEKHKWTPQHDCRGANTIQSLVSFTLAKGIESAPFCTIVSLCCSSKEENHKQGCSLFWEAHGILWIVMYKYTTKCFLVDCMTVYNNKRKDVKPVWNVSNNHDRQGKFRFRRCIGACTQSSNIYNVQKLAKPDYLKRLDIRSFICVGGICWWNLILGLSWHS